MRTRYRKNRHWLPAICAVLLLSLVAACAPSNANATPTMSVDAVYTAAYNTLIAQQATQLALTPPTSTATSTPPPTLPPLPSPLPTISFTSPTQAPFTGGGSACDSSAFVKDVTIPDNTTMTPGKSFTKTWTLLNNGTCTWGSGYVLAFDSGDQMGGVNTALPSSVGPGSSVDISVKLVAPTTNGTFKGIWRMHNASSQAFGDTPWVIIKVGAGNTATPGTTTCSGATCTITGTVNVDTSNFTIEFSSSTTTPTVTYTSNGFSFPVPKGWTGTITPVKGHTGKWIFTPASITFTNVQANQNVSFTAEEPTATP